MKGNPCNITALEYFDPEVDLNGRDIGRPKELASKTQKFRVRFLKNVIYSPIRFVLFQLRMCFYRLHCGSARSILLLSKNRLCLLWT